MKEILIQYATYNAWANTKLGDAILNLSEEQQLQPITSSFPAIKLTLLHIWDAENMWWQRMKLTENIVRPSEQSDYSTKEILLSLSQQDRQWVEWLTDATPAAIDHVFAYQNTKREQFKQPVFQMLMHVFNHSTYHRGQLITMLRQVGMDKIPATDFIVWSRRK
ncbi:MAG TPA: DinB family protein [Segetibacter sp.]|jgi:uncharacterized damage-inducible protein DinB